jgi:hypothetical protein
MSVDRYLIFHFYNIFAIKSIFRPFSKTEIVNRATEKLGKHKYNLMTYNCEHFATDCRYGQARSMQVKLEFIFILKNKRFHFR